MTGPAVRPMRWDEVGFRIDYFLQSAGFRDDRTEVCRPLPLNVAQPITRWVPERPR